MEEREFEASCILAELRSGGLSRRQALRALLATGFAAALAPRMIDEVLADEAGKQAGPGGLPLARPDKPVTLPRYEEPIKSGLEPETGGTFKLFNYADYIDKKLVEAFGKMYGVKTELTTFDSMDQAITRLATHQVQPDVTDLTPDRLDQAVAGKLIKPINLDYIPNLKKNVWPSLHSPFYDTGSHYGVPYVVYTTGIGWRADKISEDIAKLENPWSIFWNAQKYKGYVGVLDDSRESLTMAMLYRGQYDINTEDPQEIEKALTDLKALIPICNPKINITEYQTLANGSSWLHQSWSGDLLSAYFSYLPQGDDGSSLRFWHAAKGKGPIQNDTWAICSTTTKPVLAHLWLNYLLDEDVAYNNFTQFTGYQPPQVSITGDALVAKKVIPETLRNTILTAADAGPGSLQEMTLTPKGQALWQNAYARFNSGA
jgi:spermidine/putrescine transport system substrate-binding protein